MPLVISGQTIYSDKGFPLKEILCPRNASKADLSKVDEMDRKPLLNLAKPSGLKCTWSLGGDICLDQTMSVRCWTCG